MSQGYQGLPINCGAPSHSIINKSGGHQDQSIVGRVIVPLLIRIHPDFISAQFCRTQLESATSLLSCYNLRTSRTQNEFTAIPMASQQPPKRTSPQKWCLFQTLSPWGKTSMGLSHQTFCVLIHLFPGIPEGNDSPWKQHQSVKGNRATQQLFAHQLQPAVHWHALGQCLSSIRASKQPGQIWTTTTGKQSTCTHIQMCINASIQTCTNIRNSINFLAAYRSLLKR